MKLILKVVAILGLLAFANSAQAEEKTLRIGTEGAYPPFNFINPAGELSGFDVDIAKALCKEMAVTCTFKTVAWADIIPGLEKGDYDLIVASMAFSDERAKRMDYSEPYYRSHSVFVGDSTRFKDSAPETLAKSHIAAGEGTVQSEFLKKAYGKSTITLTKDQPTANALLTTGKVDLVLGDAIELLSFLESAEGSKFEYVGDPLTGDFMQSSAHVTARKGEGELIARVNEAIKKIRLNGAYDRINNSYFPFSIY